MLWNSRQLFVLVTVILPVSLAVWFTSGCIIVGFHTV
jgi:hypothetical protein